MFSSRLPISARIFVAIYTCMSSLVFLAFISGRASIALVRAVEIAAAEVYVEFSFYDSSFHWFSSLSTLGPASWKPKKAFFYRTTSFSKSRP